ncbi:MAG: TetR/AcrR family transcriptional regulator [Mycobacterium sp.]|nr:TetR/AcrR family transcriptional regulator [Mycobacterium sp.]
MAKPTAAAANDTPDLDMRAGRFMRSAFDILGETGRTDFTVVEVVERSKTSLRAFYQHFSTKDDLVLALIDRMLTEFTTMWQVESSGLDPAAALRLLVDRIYLPAESATQDSINRGLTFYHDRLAEIMADDYARVLTPLHAIICDIIRRGIDTGTFDPGLDVEITAALVMQTIFGAMRLRVLGAGLNIGTIGSDRIYAFCLCALESEP